MEELKKILAQAIEKEACASQLEPFTRFIEEGDKLSAWQTVLGNLEWIEYNGIKVPSNLEELAENQGKQWHENGILWVHKFYQDGKIHGEYKMWYKNGKLLAHELFEHGNLIKSLL